MIFTDSEPDLELLRVARLVAPLPCWGRGTCPRSRPTLLAGGSNPLAVSPLSPISGAGFAGLPAICLQVPCRRARARFKSVLQPAAASMGDRTESLRAR